jgi:hypothetical protein
MHFGGTGQRMFCQTTHIYIKNKNDFKKMLFCTYFILTTRVQLSNALRAVELQPDAKMPSAINAF